MALAIMRREVGGQAGRVGHDVDGAEQRGGDRAQLADLPVGADAAAVAAEDALAQAERGGELRGRLVLVLAVGEQDGVPQLAG